MDGYPACRCGIPGSVVDDKKPVGGGSCPAIQAIDYRLLVLVTLGAFHRASFPAGGVAEWRAMIVFTLASVCVYFSFHISAATCPDSMRRFLSIYETGASALTFRLIGPQLRATLDEESPYLVEL